MAAAAATEASALTLVSTIHIRLSLSPRLRSSNLCFRKRNPISPPFTVVSGPRDNRPPLSRGRTMSTEAILTVQALKRARGDEAAVDRIVSTKVSRLIKADLLASIAELERQDQWYLALKVFASARRENWYRTDCALYADMVAVLARSMKDAEIDLLMVELMEALEREGGIAAGDLRGPARLVKALIAARKGKAVMEVYDMMKRGGCEPNEYLFKFMIRGLKRLGNEDAACRIESDYELGGYGVISTEKQDV